ncbi:DUF551 domain-containing protein [Lelliottia amnigena]|uniref:DUF551 domain-containing protein n=1 Tax=Lelliottia amnigena TaxID=61646 RepID=UPI00339002B7
MTFTKEQLTRIIESADEVITALAGTNDDIHPDNSTKMCAAWDDLNDRNAPPSVVKKLAEMALAGMEAEPVAYMYKDKLHADARFSLYTRFGNWSQENINEYEITEIPLYATPQPLTTSERAELENYRNAQVVLTVWYGPMPESNGKTNWTAMLHRKGQHPWEGITIDCSEYPERTLYEADRMRHLIGELADEPDILAYDADKHSGYVAPGKADGNSPVIQDGWVACSERMPDVGDIVLTAKDGFVNVGEMERSGANYRFFTSIASGRELPATHWQPLPAAPQQEAE